MVSSIVVWIVVRVYSSLVHLVELSSPQQRVHVRWVVTNDRLVVIGNVGLKQKVKVFGQYLPL